MQGHQVNIIVLSVFFSCEKFAQNLHHENHTIVYIQDGSG